MSEWFIAAAQAALRIVRLVLAAAAMWWAALCPALAGDIDLRVENRFPFFKNDAQFLAIEQVFQGLSASDRKNRPALALELELERRAQAKTLASAFGNRDSIALYGWAAGLAANTCFLPRLQSHRNCILSNGEDYLKQAHAAVLVSLVAPAPSGQCRWFVDGAPATANRPCSDRDVRLADIPLGKAVTIEARQGDTVVARRPNTAIRRYVIAGMGDSFASGEGNPDRPVTLTDRSLPYGNTSWINSRVQQYPLRLGASVTSFGQPNAIAYWLNIQCHRSAYSQQLKAALQIALENRDAVVTYLGYACTGAEVNIGLVGYWAARSDVTPATRDDSPQLMRLLRDVCTDPAPYRRLRAPAGGFDWRRDLNPCARRDIPKIDAVLLSIGGNDVGFAKVIANEAVGLGNYRGINKERFKLWRAALKPKTFQEARRSMSDLRGSFQTLAAALRHIGVEPGTIIQSGYPQMLKSGTATVCLPGRLGMDVHQIFGISKTTTAAESTGFVVDLNRALRNAAPSWDFVDGFAESFAGHALCNRGVMPGFAGADGLEFPQRRPPASWTVFRPTAWRAYVPRQRWFVTPNDSFLTGNYMTADTSLGGSPDPQYVTQPLIAASLGGAFHPNALGHAVIADAVVQRLRSKLGAAQP